ncbi:MAG: 50S ribosomal protein L25 [Elusimicrobiaceae bacterium]|nr:50S ribosomal protein L25 [Elusimicrobiaceae bacterium]MBR2505176.1 50S ribosomal protein L25 [Elusimicrobiaceae bacterium]MBR5609603.1 50S ribosomal protein L25 [Elusimicrobiaceae bacterium]
MEELNITATIRTGEGVKGELSKIRAEKKVPAVIYGGHKNPVSITITMKDLEKIVKAGKNTIVEINLPEGKEQALIKEIQYHVVTDLPIHADFQRVSLKDTMDVVVPVKLVGESADVKTHGAMVEHILREIEVRALVSNIPHEIEVDITNVTITSGISAGDIKLPKGVELITDAQAPVVHLALPKEEEASSADAAAQPESSSTKGKKDADGNLTKGK